LSAESPGTGQARIKWRFSRAGATAYADILPGFINTSSIMVGNAASIMARERAFANAD
jgi:hypothetical protein